MKIELVSFSSNGCRTAEKIAAFLEESQEECLCFAPEKYCGGRIMPLDLPLTEWCGRAFERAEAVVFVCAAGIAVRAVSPFVKSKKTDPAVVVTDEKGKFAIPILSGHLGGANELAEKIANAVGALPVITTATDINGLFAVDVFAKKNGLEIESMALAKEVSAALLAGEKVGFVSDLPLCKKPPAELSEETELPLGILISADTEKKPFEKTLRLIPKKYALGMGCKKGKSFEELEDFFLRKLSELKIEPKEILSVASVDLKKDEQGLLALSEKYNLPFVTYSAEELNKAEGEFTESAFVKKTVGTGCVCERAAYLAGKGKPVQRKISENGMTFALYENRREICFE